VTDYYQLLGIPRTLNLSLDELQKRYYELSRQLHPDRFMQSPRPSSSAHWTCRQR